MPLMTGISSPWSVFQESSIFMAPRVTLPAEVLMPQGGNGRIWAGWRLFPIPMTESQGSQNL
jgi:hypothetical protein